MDAWDIGDEFNSSSLEILGTLPNITLVNMTNETGVQDGEVIRGENLTINVSVEDIDDDVDSVWVRIWEGAIGISAVIFEGFLELIAGIWTIEIETNTSFDLGEVNYTIYANDSLNYTTQQNECLMKFQF